MKSETEKLQLVFVETGELHLSPWWSVPRMEIHLLSDVGVFGSLEKLQ